MANQSSAIAIQNFLQQPKERSLLLRGDALRVLRMFPEATFDCVLTSPPYWGKREYAGGGIGMEDDSETFISDLCAICSEVHRTLKNGQELFLRSSVRSTKTSVTRRERVTQTSQSGRVPCCMGLRQHNKRISSKIPLGYDLASDGVTLTPNQTEQAAIARIVERRAKGMTLGAVARSMVADGVATKQGGQWTPKTVLAILRRQEKLAA